MPTLAEMKYTGHCFWFDWRKWRLVCVFLNLLHLWHSIIWVKICISVPCQKTELRCRTLTLTLTRSPICYSWNFRVCQSSQQKESSSTQLDLQVSGLHDSDPSYRQELPGQSRKARTYYYQLLVLLNSNHWSALHVACVAVRRQNIRLLAVRFLAPCLSSSEEKTGERRQIEGKGRRGERQPARKLSFWISTSLSK